MLPLVGALAAAGCPTTTAAVGAVAVVVAGTGGAAVAAFHPDTPTSPNNNTFK
jgi:hypothetical protein